jgi:PsbP-like protein
MIVRILSYYSAIAFLFLIFSVAVALSTSHIFPQQQAVAQKATTIGLSPCFTTLSSFLTYQNSTYGIKIQYPSNWKPKPTGSDSRNIIVAFIPAKSLFGNTSVALTIEVLSLPPILPTVHNISMSTLAPFIIDAIKQTNPDFQLDESNSTTIRSDISTIPAYKIVYTTDDHKIMKIITIKGDKAYVITYGTKQSAQYSNYLPIAQKMIDSFQIVNPKPTKVSNTAIGNTTKPSALPTTVPQFAVGSTPPSSSNIIKQKEWHSYTNSTYGIALHYPPDWIPRPVTQQKGTNNSVFDIMEFSPPVSQYPTANTVFRVGIDNITRKVIPTVQQYLHDVINLYSSAANVTDFKVIKADADVTIGGHSGYLLCYTQKLHSESTPRMYLEAGTIFENTIYYLSINSGVSGNQFTAILLPQAIQMIKSFQIIQLGPVPPSPQQPGSLPFLPNYEVVLNKYVFIQYTILD